MDKHLSWLLKNAADLKIFSIEKTLSIPEGILKKFVDGRRELPEKWHPAVINWVKVHLKIENKKAGG